MPSPCTQVAIFLLNMDKQVSVVLTSLITANRDNSEYKNKINALKKNNLKSGINFNVCILAVTTLKLLASCLSIWLQFKNTKTLKTKTGSRIQIF